MSCNDTFPKNLFKKYLNVVVGILLSLPVFQVLTEEQKRNLKSGRSGGGDTNRQKKMMNVIHNNLPEIPSSQATQIVNECLQIFIENIKFPLKSFESESISDCRSGTSSLFNLKYKKRSVSFCDTIDCVSRSQSHSTVDSMEECAANYSFGAKETTVYMTLFDDYCRQKCSGTQATAYINKCMQVSEAACRFKNLHKNTNYTSSVSTVSRSGKREGNVSNTRYSDVYFFGRKNKQGTDSGMGHTSSKFRPYKSSKNKKDSNEEQTENSENKNTRGSSKATSTGKAVSIIEDKSEDENNATDRKPSSAAERKSSASERKSSASSRKASAIDDDKKGKSGGDKNGVCSGLVATVSHIRIGPKCPVHGGHRCPSGGQGMKCIVASSENGQDAPVKVSTVTNARRGVFELVIRRMNGAPLAKNELMLEWTPPPSRPCGGNPCPIPVFMQAGSCRPSKCKMIICRPSSCRVKCSKSKCSRRVCRKPCGPIPCPVPCSPVPCNPPPCGVPCGVPCGIPCGVPCRHAPCGPVRCRKCNKPSCSGKPCRSYRPCPPPRCSPCPPPRCSPCPPPGCSPCPPSPCTRRPCAQPFLPCSGAPCSSSPCFRLCPVGRRKPRRCRSQPRIKAHRTRISPCYNREDFCPIVRCQSVPAPCMNCCGTPSCPPRKCHSIFPFKAKCCKSTCSTCCA